MTMRVRHAMLALTLGATTCEDVQPRTQVDTALVDLTLRDVAPGVVLPGSTLVIEGDAFVDDPWGESTLLLEGEVDTGASVEPRVVRLPARFVDFTTLEVDVDRDTFTRLSGGAAARFEGSATVEVRSAVDGRLYRSSAASVALQFNTTLRPSLSLQTPASVIFPNEPLAVEGDGLLLGGEGNSVALVQGCFAQTGTPDCAAIEPRWLPITPDDPLRRTGGSFAFVPSVAGINPGRFEGTVTLQNEHASGALEESEPIVVTWDLVEPALFGVDTQQASLGRYVTIDGAGFLGGEAGGNTVLRFDGIFTPDDTGVPLELDELLFPEYSNGRQVRYVINEEDAIASLIDTRYQAGAFEGLVTPVISFGDAEVEGAPTPFGFRLEPVRQVVWVNFAPAYTEGLRLFGLRAVDQAIRARALEVLRRDFETVNLEVREEEPTDYALYVRVDIAGSDPNGLGLLGYDNTPGKDTENQRLYDRIGGANAQTQEDGFPGFGGVFLQSLFGYSEHPGELAEPVRPDPQFDRLFDPFRPDVGGRPILAADLTADLPNVDGTGCPTVGDRPEQIACAVHALGTLIGSTISHEVGHSLGLADPYGPAFHNSGDQADRLMDADRPFNERAELEGEGPSRFCVDEYEYLREILPSGEPYDVTARPACF
ncbi:MAG: hypothetical protein AAGA54_15410 [Myxococcota bacterium]